jgi:hypothetical protein
MVCRDLYYGLGNDETLTPKAVAVSFLWVGHSLFYGWRMADTALFAQVANA